MARSSRTLAPTVAALAAIAALALATPSATAVDSTKKAPRFTAGSPGVGDVYYPLAGNGGYDVTHYDISGKYDPSTDVWTATTTMTAMATADLSQFNLDFDGMTISSLTVGGKPASYTRNGGELVVTPKQKIKSGSTIRVVTAYAGIPKEFVIPLEGFNLRTGFMATDDGANVAGQPDVAAGWFPVNDHPRDKAAYTFHVTVPDGLGVVANGFLEGQATANGWTTFDWNAPEPMASYLATIDIGEWDIRQWTTESGLPVYDAVDPDLVADPELGPSIDASLARQGEALDVLSDLFGPYPFSTVGAIVDDQDDLFFALETQTRPVYSKYFWPDGGDFVVTHELAHQWTGDDVALEQWQDIWLNEGWATYAEWMWGEHEGFFTPQDAFDANYAGIPADDPFWSFVIGEPPHEDLFGNPVYLRGGMTLQVLRNRVGDADFFEIAHQWTAQQGGGTGTTAQFIALSEQVSGQQLDDLFDAWLFTGTKPSLVSLSGARTAAPSTSAASPAVASWNASFAKRLAHGRY